jgi:hypothetical protein
MDPRLRVTALRLTNMIDVNPQCLWGTGDSRTLRYF